jgi:hypothetical protein
LIHRVPDFKPDVIQARLRRACLVRFAPELDQSKIMVARPQGKKRDPPSPQFTASNLRESENLHVKPRRSV